MPVSTRRQGKRKADQMGSVVVKTEPVDEDPPDAVRIKEEPVDDSPVPVRITEEPVEDDFSLEPCLPPWPADTRVPDTPMLSENDCAVCWQTFSHPVRLPCSHVFCFLCAKGFVSQHDRCAVCRSQIPAGFFDVPDLVRDEDEVAVDAKDVWFYRGRNGWWQFEERHSFEIEEAYMKGEKNHEVQIAGFIYVIDFHQMQQLRKDRPDRRRQIKRDAKTSLSKGIAGLRRDLLDGASSL